MSWRWRRTSSPARCAAAWCWNWGNQRGGRAGTPPTSASASFMSTASVRPDRCRWERFVTGAPRLLKLELFYTMNLRARAMFPDRSQHLRSATILRLAAPRVAKPVQGALSGAGPLYPGKQPRGAFCTTLRYLELDRRPRDDLGCAQTERWRLLMRALSPRPGHASLPIKRSASVLRTLLVALAVATCVVAQVVPADAWSKTPT